MTLQEELRSLIVVWRSKYKDLRYGFSSAEEVARMEGKEEAYEVAAEELELLLRRHQAEDR